MSRQPAAEHAALPQHVFGPERAAVSFDDAVGNVQTQAAAGGVALAGLGRDV